MCGGELFSFIFYLCNSKNKIFLSFNCLKKSLKYLLKLRTFHFGIRNKSLSIIIDTVRRNFREKFKFYRFYNQIQTGLLLFMNDSFRWARKKCCYDNNTTLPRGLTRLRSQQHFETTEWQRFITHACFSLENRN